MPRLNAVILEKTDNNQFRYVLWADVPSSRQSFYASTSKTSLWNQATATDILNIQTGIVLEAVGYFNVLSTTTVGDAQTKIQADWTTFQAFVNSYNPWNRYGTRWDGTAWTSTGAV